MSVLDTIAGWFGYNKARQAYPQMLLAMAEAERWNVPNSDTPYHQAELYQRLSWVAIAVEMVAQSCAAQTLNVKRLEGEKRVDVPNHPFEMLLDKPNPLMSRSEFLVATFAYRALTGNAYWHVNSPRGDSAPPAELWIIPPHKIKPIPDGRSFLRGYEYDPGNGQTMIIPPEQIVHFRRFHPLNPFVGLSPLEALSTVANADLAMQRWNANFFGKDNAKIPGILAYKEMVNDADWQRMQEENKRQWGGTNRSGPMMMRGAGDAVSWIATALSQKDMEFLAGRAATKEEIFQALGVPPALIDKTATEANSMAAKAAFSEYTLWPLLCSIAETVTLRVLPRFGGNIACEFDDPRKTDRMVDLQEQNEYARTHTIDEIREEYYEDDPLGDDRGKMLPAEIAPGLSLKLEDGNIPEPQPVPEQLAAFAGHLDGNAPEPPDAEETTEEEPAPDNGEMLKADLLRWQTKSRKRGKVAAFESEHIPDHIRAAVQVAGFDWIERWDALKAKREPDRALEARLRKRIAAIFSANGLQWVSAIADRQPVDTGPAMAELHAELATALSSAVQAEAVAEAVSIGLDFDVAEVNAAALDWTREHTRSLITGIERTTRRVIDKAIDQVTGVPGMTNALIAGLIAAAISDRRAETIAATEITRAFTEGTRVYQDVLRDNGITMQRVWQTAHDEKVCLICGPLHGHPESTWGEYDGPPAHTNCRCWTTLEYVKRPR